MVLTIRQARAAGRPRGRRSGSRRRPRARRPRGGDDPAPSAEDLDVGGAPLGQQLDQVAEVLHVAALVGADGHALDVLCDGGGDDLLDRAVVAEMDHLDPLGLEEAAHDVDGGVVAVEQARGRHEPDGMGGAVQLGGGRFHPQILRHQKILRPRFGGGPAPVLVPSFPGSTRFGPLPALERYGT